MSAFTEEQKWVVVRHNDRVPMHSAQANLAFRNHHSEDKILIPSDQNLGLTQYVVKHFYGQTVPDNTNYPDSVAPVGSTFTKLTIAAGVVTVVTKYMKTAPATWTLYGSLA